MPLIPVEASAPGSLMLMGEHAVLRGQPAIVCAISKRLTVTLRPLPGDAIRLHSALGEHETTLSELAPDDTFRFVLAAIRRVRDRLPGGFSLDIRSRMSHQMGLGSSAAVTVAAFGALAGALGDEPDPAAVTAGAVELIRKVQGGVGSGADVAASVHGGCLRYYAEPRECVKLSAVPDLTVLFSGSKTPTPEVIAIVEEKRRRHPPIYDDIDALIGRTVQEAFSAAASGDWETMGELMDVNQGLMDALGVNDATLSRLVYALRDDPRILGAKISGSGLGDCVVGLGRAMRTDWDVPSLGVQIDPEGLKVRPLPPGEDAP
ncbi:MAG: GHMP kinase [Kiritimatiellae bacterium]|nr:GHMP kinase [Kiritimatiellia bacterium]